MLNLYKELRVTFKSISFYDYKTQISTRLHLASILFIWNMLVTGHKHKTKLLLFSHCRKRHSCPRE